MSNIHVRLHKDLLWLLLDKQPLNPLTIGMLDQLTIAMRKGIRQAPKLVVITGMGEQAFCTGVDLPNDSEEQRAELLRAANEVARALDEVRQQKIPLVALIKGYAYAAGCELAALCDIVIAREDARFRLPAVNARIFPDAISTYLPAAIGAETTTRLSQSGQTLNANEARRLGLVQQVLPADRFILDTEELLVVLSTPT